MTLENPNDQSTLDVQSAGTLSPEAPSSSTDDDGLALNLSSSNEWSEDLKSTSSINHNEDQASGIRSEFDRKNAHEPVVKSGHALFENFDSMLPAGDGKQEMTIDRLMDIPVQVSVEIGRTNLPIKSVLQLAQGSVIELDGAAGEPMTVLVNGKIIAKGEVVVVNDKFGIRLTDIVEPSQRISSARK